MLRNIAGGVALVVGLSLAVPGQSPVRAADAPVSLASAQTIIEFRDAVFVAIDEEVRQRTLRILVLRKRLAETSDPAAKAEIRAKIALLRDRRQTLRDLRNSVYHVTDRRVLRLYERFVGPVSLS